jgi:BASS family bile acid:Na+ symporter
VDQFLTALSNVAVLLFVVSSMLAMGTALTVPQITATLKNGRLVLLALVANFVLVPLAALIATAIVPLSEPLKIGVILLGTAAGAPFLPKLAQFAKGNIAFSVGLMVLLMVVTIIYMPIVLPLLLPGVTVNPVNIAVSLALTMLLPLGAGLFIKARYPEPAAHLSQVMGQISNLALMLVLVTTVLANFQNIIGVIGTGGIIAGILFLVLAVASGFVAGRFAGGSDVMGVMALGTGQRNISASMLVATQNFTDPNVLVMIMVVSTLGLFVLFPIAGELGKRAKTAAGEVAQVATPATPPQPQRTPSPAPHRRRQKR